MIKVNGHVVVPTAFPDKTSQVWKLPDHIVSSKRIEIEWRFEQEREIIDLASVATLLAGHDVKMDLHMPYLPYARQDKFINNSTTFNLVAFATLINALGFDKISALDAHNPLRCSALIPEFKNLGIDAVHNELCDKISPDVIVFPDEGAKARYPNLWGNKMITFRKVRDQESGEIIFIEPDDTPPLGEGFPTVLIVDDICDGGRTFIEVAKYLRASYPSSEIHLFVTHGIFSKGKDHLLKNGIDFIHTTNSLKQYTEMEIFNV